MTDLLLRETVERLRLQRNDDAFAEAKASVGKLPKDVWSTVSAFANTSGGLVILGLDEAGGLFRPAHGFDPKPIINALSDGFNGRRGEGTKIMPVPPHEIERAEIDGAPVVVVTIRPLQAEPAPCYVFAQGVENGSYRRWDDQNIHLSSYQIFLLRNRKRYLPFDKEAVPGSGIQDLNPQVVESVVRHLRDSRSRIMEGVDGREDVVLRRLQVLSAGDQVTLAGLLSLGSYPQQFFPNLFIDVVVHPGTEKSSAIGEARFIDRQECDGSIPQMVDDAVAATLRNLRTRRVVRGVSGIDVPEVPPEVLREAITNAVIHRDYSPQAVGQQVAVDVYPDRIEVSNPGGFWGGVTRENIAEGNSRSRNDSLARLLTKVPLPRAQGAVVENQGSGVPLMVGSLRSHGLPAPVFESTGDVVKVTIHRHGVLTEQVAVWLAGIGGSQLNEQLKMVLALAREHAGVGVVDIRSQFGWDSDDARSALEALADAGHLIPVLGDFYQLPSAQSRLIGSLSPTQQRIIAELGYSVSEALTMRELVDRLGGKAATLRAAMSPLVDAGIVAATAPPTSRNRAYLMGPKMVDGR